MTNFAPLCFVLMPFGKKPDAAGLTIDFDAVYGEVIKPAISDVGLEPLRADEEMTGGIIHKPMYERLILCPFAVADLTTANANVFYELGVRHAARPASTVLLFAEGGRLPFDVGPLRAMPYKVSADGRPADAAAAKASLAAKLEEARRVSNQHELPFVDSPIFQLVESFPNIQHEKTDVFRDRVVYARKQKDALASARREGADALIKFEKSLGDIDAVESGVIIDLFLSYRSLKAWQQMIDLAAKMPRPLLMTVMVQEQLALALNRAEQDDEAERVLLALLSSRGASSETYGILGRVYKDRYDRAQTNGNAYVAHAELGKAIDAYLKGFEADWRDAYPGVNAITLMELREPPDPRQKELVPVVTYAVKRKIASGKPDYWDYATLLELGVLGRDEAAINEALGEALSRVREKWEPETTLKNIDLIASSRRRRGESIPPWLDSALAELKKVAS
jgi:hypothetical protein